MPPFRRLPSVHRRRVSSYTLLLWGSIALLAPATVSAAPLTETEPNNSSLAANGPFGPDGFTSTINVSDDVDYVIFRLQGRRQVGLQFTNVLGGSCGVLSVSVSGAGFFGLSTGSSKTWTTPRDATEYLVRISSGTTGCQTLVKATPADALITGPLPPLTYNRTLAVTVPAQVDHEVQVPITAAGIAADEDQVAVQWTTGGCPAAPPGANSVALGPVLASGPYNVTVTTTSPDTSGAATLCTWLYDRLGKLEPLLRQQTVTVVPPPVDDDRDGVVAGPDCNDRDAAIKPGAGEVRGNAVDENCDGRAEPYPRAPATATLTSSSVRGGRTRIKSLVVRQVTQVFSVRVRCTGGGCRTRVNRTFSVRPGSQKLLLTGLAYGLRLAPGAKLSIKVAADGYLSRVFVYTMRRGRSPSRSARCANPGATATFAC